MWLTTSVTNHFSDFLILIQFSLNRVPHIPTHNGFMIIFQIVALKRDCLIRFLCDQVFRMCLLKKLITFVGFILKSVKRSLNTSKIAR